MPGIDPSELVAPKGVEITITEQHVILNFANKGIPPVKLSSKNAERIGGRLQSAAHKSQDR
jgi:hypothetical protein